MRRAELRWFFAFSIALTIVAGTAGASGPVCRRLDLELRPSWVFHGAWVSDGTELVLSDTMAGRLLRYDRSGAHLHPVNASRMRAPAFTRPNTLVSSDRGLIVLDMADRLFLLRQDDFHSLEEIRLRDISFSDGDRLGVFLSFIEAGGGDFLGLTTLLGDDGRAKWWGIARLRLGDTPAVERIYTLPSMSTAAGNFYLSHTGPYLAKVDGAVYALLFGDDPHIEKLLPARKRLAAFPEGYFSPPLTFSTKDSTRSTFRTWEASAAPVALFGRGDFLHLLTRRPHRDGGTEWTIHQIDPARDALIRAIKVPSRALHLIVIPGPREWAIIEKGNVTEAGGVFEQVVGPVLLIPSSLIEDRTAGADLAQCVKSAR